MIIVHNNYYCYHYVHLGGDGHQPTHLGGHGHPPTYLEGYGHQLPYLGRDGHLYLPVWEGMVTYLPI